MTRIGLISDTHCHFDSNVYKHFEHCDEIWHAGDIGTIEVADKLAEFKPLKAVYGNIDGQDVRKVWPKNQRFFCEKVDVWITHIGGYPGKYWPEIRQVMKINPPKLFICGHSHILKVMYDEKYGLLHMNPGAAGITGVHKVKTLLRFSIDGKEIKDLQVIEIGLRSTGI
ncbi:MAG: YfcE family phosphodiesterase [Flavobacteriales bacterium]|nr:MAG: YfcE family phosphodiesterase [Flavobacteriales bacterium]